MKEWDGQEILQSLLIRLVTIWKLERFLAHFMENLKLEQGLLDGATPFFAPVPKVNDAQNPFLTNAGAAVWGDAATFIPYTLYRHFRDKGLLKQYIELMTDWVDWIINKMKLVEENRLWDFGMATRRLVGIDTGIKGSVLVQQIPR